MPETREIPRAGWNDFFSAFTKEHELQLVALEVMGAEIGAQVEGQSLLLSGVSPGDNKGDSVAVMVDSLNGEHLTHMVSHPTHVWLQRAAGADQALEIQAADGSTTLLRFASHDETGHDDTLIGSERFPRKGDEPF
jgi:hypothetical protein